jgi:hypothetical protein
LLSQTDLDNLLEETRQRVAALWSRFYHGNFQPRPAQQEPLPH